MKKQIILSGVVYIFIVMSMVTVAPVMSTVAYARSMFVAFANNAFCPVTGTRLGKRVFYAIVKNKRWGCASQEAMRELMKNPDKYLTREFLAKL